MPRIGVLMVGDENDALTKPQIAAFTQALADSGWIDGRNMRLDLRWGGTDTNRTRALAQELVASQPDIILAGGDPVTDAIQRETRTIPIVFAGVTDPVALHFVARLDRPSGNTTGFADFELMLGGKWLELLSEIAPGLKRAPDTFAASVHMPAIEAAARSLMVESITAPVYSDVDIETAITRLGRESGGGLVVLPGVFMFAHRAPIISTAARNKVPAVYPNAPQVRDGGLLSYGVDRVDIFRRAVSYVDRILRGEKPGDLPVQFPVKYEMVVNLKTAESIGLSVPESFLLRANEVIE